MKKYLLPSVTIIEFEMIDVITGSNFIYDDTGIGDKIDWNDYK